MSQHLFAFERAPGVRSEPLITGAARTQLSLPFSGGFEGPFGRGSLLVCGYFSCPAAPSRADPARDGQREQEDPPAWELGDSRGSAGSQEVPGFARDEPAGRERWLGVGTRESRDGSGGAKPIARRCRASARH